MASKKTKKERERDLFFFSEIIMGYNVEQLKHHSHKGIAAVGI